MKNKQGIPIGYFIDVECVSTNITKSNTTLSFNIQNIPIGINFIYCDNALAIKKLNFSNQERSQLNFFIEFNLLKKIDTQIKMHLNLNTE